MQVKAVLRGGAAEQAGLATGDEWLGVEVEVKSGKAKTSTAWRISKLDEVAFYAGHASHVMAVVSRDKRLLKLPLALPQGITTWRLAVREAKQVSQWLGG